VQKALLKQIITITFLALFLHPSSLIIINYIANHKSTTFPRLGIPSTSSSTRKHHQTMYDPIYGRYYRPDYGRNYRPKYPYIVESESDSDTDSYPDSDSDYPPPPHSGRSSVRTHLEKHLRRNEGVLSDYQRRLDKVKSDPLKLAAYSANHIRTRELYLEKEKLAIEITKLELQAVELNLENEHRNPLISMSWGGFGSEDDRPGKRGWGRSAGFGGFGGGGSGGRGGGSARGGSTGEGRTSVPVPGSAGPAAAGGEGGSRRSARSGASSHRRSDHV